MKNTGISSVTRTSVTRLSLLLAATLAFALGAAHAQDEDEATGWPGFNADNTIRGTVISAAPNTFNIRTDDGATYKVLYSVNSRIMANRGPGKAADIHTGDMLIATGNLDNKAKTIGAAVLIGVGADEVKKARDGLGKTWTAGRITAVSMSDAPKITLSRLDGINQTIAVDENTSFKRHHESITMADIKAGEGLRAEGHLVGKAFLAATVNVFTPGHYDGMPGTGPEQGNTHP
jgi:hypothetical protein